MIFNAADVTNRRVAVVAAGCISPLGIGLDEIRDSLLAARDCVSLVDQFDVQRCRCKTAAQVPQQGLKSIAKSRDTTRLHPASLMMIGALDEALNQDGAFRPELTVIGTTSGGMSFGQQYYRALSEHSDVRRA